ncbi:PQQ-binding-like beta-propeller repeat protein [Natronoarchaeum sp. GCM10025703]|uniref:outer membrane protein assembly factor BamB family protein n=1 Tax=unclassified Natronoarchaeum TaxID=2620183 RepID=UPI00360DA34A
MPSHSRRQLLTLLGAATVGLAGCQSSGRPSGEFDAVDGDWPTEGANPRRTRRVASGPTEPETVWTTQLDDARGAGSPSIADSRVYALADAVSDRARHRYRLHALDARTGEERWRVPLRSDPNGSPAVGANRIVVSAQRGIEQGRLVAVEAEYGDEQWLFDVDARVTASPTVDGRWVYLPDWDGTVHALSVTDGAVRWSRQIGADDTNHTFAIPAAVDGDTVFLGSLSGWTGLVAVDAATGAMRWSRSTPRVVSGPAVDDGLVVVQAGDLLVGFDTDGTERWTFAVPGGDRASKLALDEQHVYVATQDALVAVGRDGGHSWTYEFTSERGGPPTVVDGEVLVYDDGLTAVGRDDGQRRWTVDSEGGGDVVATPAAVFTTGSGGQIFAMGAD